MVAYSYNKEFYLNFAQPYALTIISFLFGISVVLDLICWKNRRVASCLFYFECVHLLISGLIV